MDEISNFSDEAETALIGAMIVKRSVIREIANRVQLTDFYKDANRIVFGAIVDLDGSGSAVDILILSEHIKSIGKWSEVGGAAGMARYTSVPVCPSRNVLRRHRH